MHVCRTSLSLRVFGCLASALLFAQPAPVHAQAGEASTPRSASEHLEAGERQQLDGNHVAAAQAYRDAFEALTLGKRAQNEGARAAVLSAGAFWDAFAEDPATEHLAYALAILHAWQNAAGPNPTASSAAKVERLVTTLSAVHEPLALADVAVAQGNFTGAGAAYAKAFEALIAQKRDSSVLERLAQRVARAFIDAYERASTSPSSGEDAMQALDAGLALMRRYAGYASGVGVAAANIERRREVAVAADREAVAAAPGALDIASEPSSTPVTATEPAPERVSNPERSRRGVAAPVAMVSVGVAVLATGAAFLGDGLHQRARMERQLSTNDEKSAAFEAMLGTRYDKETYAAARDETREANARRNTGFVVAGSVLLAAGATTAVIGIVQLVRRRATTGPSNHARIRVGASASRSRFSVALAGSF